MLSKFSFLLIITSFMFNFLNLHAEEKHKHTSIKGTQKVCPIREEPIDKEVVVDYQGQRVYFCCAGCDTKFLKNPNKYLKEMKERGEVTESIQTHCPVSDEKLGSNKKSITLPGRKIYFCCKKCVKQFKKDKETYLKKLDKKSNHKAKGHKHGKHNHN